jgi:hypothetical protein
MNENVDCVAESKAAYDPRDTRRAVEIELDQARDLRGGFSHMVSIYPKLQLRGDLAKFASDNGLEDERDALAVVAARYFAAERAKPKCGCEERW